MTAVDSALKFSW